MDGFETARRIRALPAGREVPIVFLTAIHRDEAYARRGYASGAADYITKPFDVDVLRARVRAFVDLYRQREEAHRASSEMRTRELGEAQRRLAAFERISTAALETGDLHGLLHTLLTIFLGAADAASTASILLRRGDTLVAAASIGVPPEDPQSPFETRVGEGFVGRIAATGRPTLLVGAEIAQAANVPWIRKLPLRALYGVPLVRDGDVIGVAHIGSTTADGFSEPEKRLLQAMAERAAWVVSRKQAGDRLYAVLDAAPAAISVWRGPPYACEYANLAYRALFPGDGASSTTLGAAPDIVPLFGRVIENGETVCLAERPWIAGNEERIYRISLHALRDALGKPEAVLSVAIDLTEQVQARRALEKSERERARLLKLERDARQDAEAANHAKDEFLATVSHELRTPLNSILGWTTSLRRGVVTDSDRALGVIERNARAQARIIEDVLDLSRIVKGKLRLDVGPTEISVALFAAVEAVRPTASAKSIRLDVEVAEDLGIVMADPDRIQQVVWNLLANAVKFTPDGGHAQLKALAVEGKIVVSVADSGQGIEPHLLPHVFEPFRQGDSSATRRHGGLGLGLAIVKELVQAHGGTVRAESGGAGKGAIFVVELPVRKAGLNGWPVRDTGRTRALIDLHGTRVLVVDDDDDARTIVRAVLVKQGAIVSDAQSARDALGQLRTFRPDVIVADIGMPEVDGYEFVRALRARPPEAGGDTPAIALTAYAGPEDERRALDAGFQVHAAKPMDPSRLVEAVLNVRRRVT
jgi:signal transduction histidine kinase/DNA-binding response OmpR family regulator